MKLDFSALARPAGKARGHMGTTGTQAFMRVPASPRESRRPGTTGDKPAAAVLALDPLKAVPAVCPPVSPVCPPSPTLQKAIVCAASPVSPLVPVSGVWVAAAANRPHRLTKDEADRCHAPCWNDAEIAAFTTRAARFAQMGRADADDLAERLTLRDRDDDDRRLCLECTWLGDAGRCLAAASGGLPGADRRLEPVQTTFQRCVAFGLRKGLV